MTGYDIADVPVAPTGLWLDLFTDHSDACDCDPPESPRLMRWTPDCGVYRPSDYDTPLYTPRSTR